MNDIKIINGIYDLLTETLAHHIEVQQTHGPAIDAMGKDRFRRTFQIAKISLPRSSGHTRAAMKILSDYPHSIYLTEHSYVRALQKQYPEVSHLMFSLDIALPGSHFSGMGQIRTMMKLAGHPDFIFIDSSVLTEEELHMIFDHFNPKIMVLLGDYTIKP